LHETAGGTENEDRRTNVEPGGDHAPPALLRRLQAESARKRKKCPRGQRKSLKRLNSVKEIKGFYLVFFGRIWNFVRPAWVFLRKFGPAPS
jgi:hypothetical protein